MKTSIDDEWQSRRIMTSVRATGAALTTLGLAGAATTLLLGLLWAPSVDPEAWNAPEAYRILFWHVPFAWSSFLAFCVLLVLPSLRVRLETHLHWLRSWSAVWPRSGNFRTYLGLR